MSTATPAPPATRTVPTRRISFDDALDRLPRYFAADEDLFMCHMTAALSAVFPDGEDFFVRSVRRFRDQITDPVLKRQVAGFIGQEATHGREHRTLNARLAELGYPTRRIETTTRWVLGARERIMSARSNLAATAALEHFTATLAEVVLGDDEARQALGDSVVSDLLVWHALEECEHKAVAFDVYRHVGGTEPMRVWTMRATAVLFLSSMMLEACVSMLGDRRTYRRGSLRRAVRTVRRSPFLDRRVIARLRDYNRPDFHPDDHDTDALLARWRDDLFGDDGRLVERLTTAA